MKRFTDLAKEDFDRRQSFSISSPPVNENRASLAALEGKVHAMKLRERLTLAPSSDMFEMIRMKSEVDAAIAEKDEEIRQLKYTFQKLTARYKADIFEKDQQLRKMHNELVDLKGQIRVAVRVRKWEPEEQQEPLRVDVEGATIRCETRGIDYRFEHIFGSTMTQETVFEQVNELILSVLHGYNVCLIAYGPTGSGKTFTMRGGGDSSPELEGVIPRAIRFLLDHSSQHLASIGWEFRFAASYLEVYNEEVFDLLDQRKKCDVKGGGASSSTTNVVGLKKLPVNSIDDTQILMDLADSFRSTASTNCNSQSSRSHAIFQIHVDGIHANTGAIVKCCLNLVDLAGSERAKESGAQGARFTELTNINQSLSTLKKCIRAQMTKSSHVPFRESKLTILLKTYLGGGSSKTMFIAHLNPNDAAETRRTLEFTKDLRSTNLGRAQVQK